MSDLWAHSHDWDKGYAVGHKVGYKQGREDAIDECVKAVKSFFCELIENNPEWEIDSIDDYALKPNKEICERLMQIKEQKND